MGYLTCKQVSEKFGIPLRDLQKMCREGTIEGAVRQGRGWLIPDDSDIIGIVSEDMPCVEPIPQRTYSGITDIYKNAGSADAIINALTDDFSRDIFASQLAFYRGEYEKSIELAKKHFVASETSVAYRSAVGMQLMLGSIAVGDIGIWRQGRDYLAESECTNENALAVRDFYLAAGACAISDATQFPEWFKRGDFLQLPRQSYPAAFYNYVKYLYTVCHDDEQRGEHQSAIDLMHNMPYIIEPMISVVAFDKVIVIEIYLRLLCALAYHISGRDDVAIIHIDKAIDLAIPDKLYTPLAEYRRRFGFLMDDRFVIKYESELPELKRISKQLSDGWVQIHNRHMGRNVTNKLSTREWQTARLASYGLSNRDIAERMGITVNAVKQALRLAMDKTGAENRAEISKYI